MAYAHDQFEAKLTGTNLELSVDEAQSLFDLLYRGVGNGTLLRLELHETLWALRESGCVVEESTVRFEGVANLFPGGLD